MQLPAAGRETVYAIRHDGERSWTQDATDGGVGSSTVASDNVRLRRANRLTALSAETGEKRWSATPSGQGDAVVTPEAAFVTGGERLLALGEK
jgi:outer membrane protein assembly factor BamB